MRATPNSASCFDEGVPDITIMLIGIGERSHNFSMYLASFRLAVFHLMPRLESSRGTGRDWRDLLDIAHGRHLRAKIYV